MDEESRLRPFLRKGSNIFVVRPDFVIFNEGKGRAPQEGDSIIEESLSLLERNFN